MKVETTYKIINLFKKRKWSVDSCHFSFQKHIDNHILYLNTYDFNRWKELMNIIYFPTQYKQLYSIIELENYFIEYIIHEIPELKKEEIVFVHTPF